MGVVSLVGSGRTRDDERKRRDVRSHARRLDERVVARVRSGDHVARDGHALGRTDVLISEDPCPAGDVEGDGVAGDDADRTAGDGRIQEGVVSLIGGRDAGDSQGQRGDIGGHPGRLDQGVVGGVRSRNRITADGDALTRTHVLVGEDTGAVRRVEGDRVAGKHADGSPRDRGGQESVVGLVGGDGASDSQGQRGDVRGHARRLHQGVVTRIRSRNRVARDGDRLARPDVLVREDAGTAGDVERDGVTGDWGDGSTGDGCGQELVVGLVRDGRPSDGQGKRGDIGGHPGRLDQGIVGSVGARDRVTRDGDRLTRADVLIGEDPCPAGDVEGDGVARDGADRATRNGGGQELVVGLVGGGRTGHRQRQCGDVSRHAGRLDERVVGGVRAGEGVTRDRDRLGRTDVLVREDAGATGRHEGDGVARNRGDGAAADGRRQLGIVGLAGRRGAGDRERQRRDIRRQAGRLDQRVVGSVGARNRVARDGDRLARADVLVAKDTGATGDIEGDGVAGDDADRTTRDRHRQEGVVSLVGRGGTGDSQRECRDIGGHAGRLDERVVGRVGTRDRITRDGDRLTRADVLIGEDTRSVRRHEGDGVARNRGDGAAGDGSRQESVVGLVGRGGASDGQGESRDVRGDARRLDDRVVGGVSPGEGVTADRDGLAHTDVLVREGPCPAGGVEGDGVAGDDADRATRNGGGQELVVGLVRGGRAGDGERQGRDVTGHAGRLDDHVVAGRRPAQGEARIGDRLARTDVPVREGAGGARGVDRDDVAGNRRDRAAGHGSGQAAVVDLGRIESADGQALRGDVRGEAARLGDDVVTGIRTAQDIAARGHALGDADVAIGEHAGGGRGIKRDGVTGNLGDDATGKGGDVRTVVDLVHGGHAGDGQGQRGDVRGDTGGLGDGVIAGIIARKRITARGDGLARTDVPIGEHPRSRGNVEGDGVAGNRRDRSAREGRGEVTVVDLVRGGHARDGERQRGDVRGEAGRLDDDVVTGICAAEGITRGGDGLGRADIPIGERARAAGGDQVHGVAREGGDRTARKRRGDAAVVDLVRGGDARDRERQRSDVRGEAGRLADGVITSIRSAEDDTRNGDGLGRADVPIGEAAHGGRGVDGHDISAERGHGSARDDGRQGTVVDLVYGGDAGKHELERGDVAGQGTQAADLVAIDGLAARGGTRLDDDGRRRRERDELSGAGITRGVGSARDRESGVGVAADEAARSGDHRAGDVGDVGLVVDLGRRRGERGRQRGRQGVKQSLPCPEHGRGAVGRIILAEVEGQAAGDIAGADMIGISVAAPDAPGLARAAGRQGGAAGVVDETSGGHRDVPVRRGERAGRGDGHGARALHEDVAGRRSGQSAVQGDVASVDRDRSRHGERVRNGDRGVVGRLADDQAGGGGPERVVRSVQRAEEFSALGLQDDLARAPDRGVGRGQTIGRQGDRARGRGAGAVPPDVEGGGAGQGESGIGAGADAGDGDVTAAREDVDRTRIDLDAGGSPGHARSGRT